MDRHHHLVEKRILKNGLTVLLVPLENAASVTMSVLVKAGSRYEKKNLNGISHFLEHLHFKGSKTYPTAKKLSEVIDRIGGEFNANTGKEHTQYYIRSAHEHFDLIFKVLTDMLLHPHIDRDELQKEKGVIIEEINMYRDNPQVHVESLFEEMLWPDSPLGRDIAGTPEVIKAIKPEDVHKYRHAFYRPNNMILAIGGKFNQREVMHKVVEHWGELKPGKISAYEPAIKIKPRSRVVLQTKQTEQAHIVMGLKGYPYKHKNNNAMRLLTVALGGGMSSRLFIKIRERLGLAYYVSAGVNNYLDTGNFTVSAGLKVSATGKAIDVLVKELAAVRAKGITRMELKKAKEYVKGKTALALENPHDKLEWYLGQEAFMGRIKAIRQLFHELDKVTEAEVLQTAREIIKPEDLRMALIGPFTQNDVGKFESKLKF